MTHATQPLRQHLSQQRRRRRQRQRPPRRRPFGAMVLLHVLYYACGIVYGFTAVVPVQRRATITTIPPTTSSARFGQDGAFNGVNPFEKINGNDTLAVTMTTEEETAGPSISYQNTILDDDMDSDMDMDDDDSDIDMDDHAAAATTMDDDDDDDDAAAAAAATTMDDDAPTAPEVNTWTTVMSHDFLDDESDPAVLEQLYRDMKDMDEFDTQEVEKYWEKLMPMVSYLGTERCCKVYSALRVAYRAHRGQMRKSGEPFIIHPVDVALLLSGLKMDAETVMAGLLHDTVEDTDLTFDQVQAIFGPVVRNIVEGETKVSKLPKIAFAGYADEQAENLRQMFVAMSDDYRIIIVKLADRLHNMRTLKHMKPEKQIKISRETLDIFAPLAHRMGIWQFKSELEDIAFMYLYPQEYKRLNRRLREHQNKFRDTLDKSQKILLHTLNHDRTIQEQAQEIQVHGRTKEIYSLWHKMETKGEHNLNNIIDVVALRVIITPKQPQQQQQQYSQLNNNAQPTSDNSNSGSSHHVNVESPADRGVWLCYHVLGLVQHLPGFQPVPTRVKDYISFPKPNGYQSLHTALMLNGQMIEVQIRTNIMHQVAEYGMASHWGYTDAKRRMNKHSNSNSGTTTNANNNNNNKEEIFNTPWLASIKEWQDDSINSRDFVDSVRKELLGKRVFVFLRNGKILNLARGATAIDAAFQIHTEVGLNMHGVEINGKPVPFHYELQNGDVVSILIGKGKPQTDWMRHAKSRSTRSKLRSYFRAKKNESLREAGKILLMDYLWMHGPLIEKTSYRDEAPFTIPTTVEEVAAFLPGKTQYSNMDDLLKDIGKKHDRLFLHSTIAKLFYVPQSLLIDAEANRSNASLVPSSVIDAVGQSRQLAMDAAEAAYDDAYRQQLQQQQQQQQHQQQQQQRQKEPGPNDVDKQVPLAQVRPPLVTIDSIIPPDGGGEFELEYADPEHLCTECLPVFGDQIIGTKPADKTDDATTTVHRVGCQVSQRAVNAAHAKALMLNMSNYKNKNGFSWNLKKKNGVVAAANTSNAKSPRIDSVTLRMVSQQKQQKNKTAAAGAASNNKNPNNIVPVKLQWSDDNMPDDDNNDGDTNKILFKAEIVIVAQDRKLLLADCSEIVSELSEILKTGSATTNEHATLVFLVRVSSLAHLQRLMDKLSEVRSVMSVERRFGSELL